VDDNLCRILFELFAQGALFEATGEAAVSVVHLAVQLITGYDDIRSVDNYNVVTAIDVGRELWFALTGQQGSHLRSNPAE
jgi:hypothetical protein